MKIKEYVAYGYKITSILAEKLNEIIQNPKFQDRIIDLLIELVINSEELYGSISELSIKSLMDKSFIKFLPYLIVKRGIDEKHMNDIHNKVSNIITENLSNPDSHEVINDLLEILRLALQYEYYSVITPEEILEASQKEEIESSHQIKMLSLLPFYDIRNGNSKYC